MTVSRWLIALVIASLIGAEARARSPQRLAELCEQFDRLEPQDPQADALREAIDAEAAQRYAWASRLFWHTDLAAAQEAARRERKPILSLRMLGRLTDELSCANSRFFRVALYANRDVSELLRERFVLHWASERPVPVVTIDYGDGRVVRRTVTGNSIHYLLDPDGRPLDAMPGMVGPGAFHQWLAGFETSWAGLAAAFPAQQRSLNARLLQQKMRQQQTSWALSLARIGRDPIEPPPGQQQAAGRHRLVPAELAVPLAVGKGRIEIPLIPVLTMSGRPVQEIADAELWDALAVTAAEQSKLDEASLALLRWQRPLAADQGEEAMQQMVERFEHSVAVDTVRNQFLLQRRLRTWLLNTDEPLPLADLNRRVYNELFETPREDPWLGLMPLDAYTGLERSGLQAPNHVGAEADSAEIR